MTKGSTRQLRIPRTVTVFGRTFTVTTSRNHDGASCRHWQGKMHIGHGAGRGIENFLHESLEYILRETHCRYANHHSQSENGDYVFVANHHQFEEACRLLADPVRQLIAANGGTTRRRAKGKRGKK